MEVFVSETHSILTVIVCYYNIELTVSEPAAVTNSCKALTDNAWKITKINYNYTKSPL